jgi:hypothetical protein
MAQRARCDAGLIGGVMQRSQMSDSLNNIVFAIALSLRAPPIPQLTQP